MQMASKKNIIFLYVLFMLLIIVFSLFAFAYAYYQNTGSVNYQTNYEATFDGNYNFSTVIKDKDNNTNPTVSMDLNDFAMYNYGDKRTVFDENYTLTVSLTNNYTDKSLTCSYNIVWVWDDEYKPSSLTSGELTVTNASTEKNITTSTTTILSDFITSTASGTNSKNQTFRVRFYNLASDQSTHAGQNYKGSIKVSDVVCS